MQENVYKKIVSEFLSFLKFKVDNDLLTMSEVESLAEELENNLPLIGTADDFARYYGKSRTNVSSVINRGMIEKPTRRVFYRFSSFRKIKPKSWESHTDLIDNQNNK